MTIAERITEQTNLLDLDNLTIEESEWLHFIRNLAMWSYIAKVRREMGI